MILVTGGAGYVGAVLCENLIQKGLPIRIFDQFYFGKEPIKSLSTQAEIVEGDIRNFPEKILDDVDTLIHLAAISNDPTADFAPEANHQINTISTIKLAKIAKKMGVKKFIFASSCSIYDLGKTDGVKLQSEDAKVKPTAAYSVSKFAAEKGLLALADENFCVVILRKGTVFGFSPRMRYDLVVNTMVKDGLSKQVIKIYGEGIEWRPLVDVGDVANAYWAALVAPKESVNGQIVNIALDNFLVKDVGFLVQRTLAKLSINSKIIFVPNKGKIRSYKVSNGKAEKILNFKPKNSIEKSVTKMVKEIRDGNLLDFENPVYYNIDWMRPILEKETQPLAF